jgi:uncharacterized membrane protein
MPNSWRAVRGATGVSAVIRWVPWLAMARPLGGRAGTDRAPVHRDATRLVAFSDAVFAITVTLLVLEIRPPTDYRNLLHGLLALWPSYLAYGVTFMFIGQVWANHHVMFDHIRAADRVVLLLNTLLLMAVAFLPFATSVLAGALRSGHGQRTAVVFYGIAFALTALTFNAVWQYACRHGLLSDALDPAGATAISRRFQLALAWLATGAFLGALLPVLGLAMIVAFNAFYWLPIQGESPRPRPCRDVRGISGRFRPLADRATYFQRHPQRCVSLASHAQNIAACKLAAAARLAATRPRQTAFCPPAKPCSVRTTVFVRRRNRWKPKQASFSVLRAFPASAAQGASTARRAPPTLR